MPVEASEDRTDFISGEDGEHGSISAIMEEERGGEKEEEGKGVGGEGKGVGEEEEEEEEEGKGVGGEEEEEGCKATKYGKDSVALMM